MITRVELTKGAVKDLSKLPDHIVIKFQKWVEGVSAEGLEEVRKVPGWHDEPLKGDRKGQRSIRLSKSYRAIYEVNNSTIEFVEVKEINKHEY